MVNFDQRDAQQLFFQLSSVLVFAIGMFFHQREIKLSKLNIAIGALLIAFVVAWLRTFNALPSETAPRWYIAMNFIFGIMVYLTVIRTFKKDDIRFVLKGLAWFTGFCVLILILQFFGYDFRGAQIWKGVAYAPTESIFFQRSAMGMYFANNIPLLLALSPFDLLLPFALLLLVPMYVAQSTAAYLGAMAAILFFFWFRKRIYFWITLGLVIIAIPVMLLIPKLRNEAMTGLKVRIPMWGTVIQDISRNPLGYGLDSFAHPTYEGHWKYFNYFDNHVNDNHTIKAVKIGNEVKGLTDEDNKLFRSAIDGKGFITFADHPHNEYIWLAYEIGIQALIILGFIFYFLWDRFRRSKRDTLTCATMGLLICIAIECLLQFPLHLSRIGHILPIILGFFYISSED
jgi:hypothetical protein